MVTGLANAPMRRRVTALAVLLALLTTAACGARWSDEERAAVFARSEVRAAGPAAVAEDGTAQGSGTTVPGADGAAVGPTGGTGGTDGASGGGGTGGSAAGARPCAAPSDAPGISEEAITVGSISTVSGPVPGLGETSEAAVRAYVAYRNATGGVCGRQLVLKTADDAFDNSRYRAAITEMASQVIGIAGGLGNADGGGVDVVQAENIPVVATASADSFQALPQVFDINPPFADIHAETAKFRWLYDQGVRTAALVYIDAAQVKSQVEQQRAQMEAVGIRIVLDRPVPLSTLSYDTHARAVANSKADYLFYPAAGNLNAAMARSMEDTGYKLKFGEYLTAYGSNFIELAGSAAEGAVSFARALPTEEAASNPEATAFVQWMGRVAPGVPADTFAADAWASAKAFIDNLDALPGPISREALIAQLRTVETYDAAGFFGPIQLGAKRSNGCVIGMRVVSGQWQRIVPQRGFLC
jgi:ABC-type branched-subunit amino acid transport system substrate-binding protein